MKVFAVFLAIVSILFMHACSGKPVHVPISERVAQQKAEEQSRAADLEKHKDGAITEEELARAEEERRRRAAEEAMRAGQIQDVFFEFDSYNIRPADVPVLKDLATRLNNTPGIKLVIEGHCDERGTTDYNLALGQKRAEAAKDFLIKSGVSETRIKAVSYGKEAPIVQGHGEEAWTKNRRAHFVIQ